MFLNKLTTALWKCLRIRKRHYVLTLVVLGIPILLFGLIAWARMKIGHISKEFVNETTYVAPMSEEQLYARYRINVENGYLLYAPQTQFTEKLMDEVQKKMEIHNDKYMGFNSEEELVLHYNNMTFVDMDVLAVIFDELEGDSMPDLLQYRIRTYEAFVNWQTDMKFNTMTHQYIPEMGSTTYFTQDFINLQLAIDKMYLQLKTGKDELGIEFSFQEFPYPPHYNDAGLIEIFIMILPLVTVFSTVFIFPGTLKRMMEEKESGIKELTKMMGLSPSIMYGAWFIDAMIPCTISVVICTIFMKISWGSAFPPMEYTNGVLYGIFLFLYFASCVAFCLFMGTVLDSPSMTTNAGMLIWVITYTLPPNLKNLQNWGFLLNLILCIMPNFAMFNAYNAISNYELRGVGIQWNNLFSNGNGGVISFGLALVMLFVDIFVFLLVGYYLDQVNPGKHGLPKPWNYPYKNLMSYFTKMDKSVKRKNSVDTLVPQRAIVEDCTLEAGVIINNLSKQFGDRLAVNNLSLKFFNGEIAVLLGRNGAGKTTTMSIITGMLQATSGDVLIDKFHIGEHLTYIRSILGICPQQDLLFPELTVREHLIFFGKMNNVLNLEQKVETLMKQLGIYEQRNKVPNDISGGMKRKLCFGMAIIFNPKVLIMDEPTSGLDPKSRRDMWDLILNWRTENPNAVILVSTHFMEEADALGDRITIIESGTLVAQGSPMFLKNEFANDCSMTLNLKQSANDDVINGSENSVRANFGDVRISQKDGTYVLHWDKKDKKYLIDLLTLLNRSGDVENVGISISTLEDVFLKLAKIENVIPLDQVVLDTHDHSGMPTVQTSGNYTIWNKLYESFQRYGGFSQLRRYLPYVLMAWLMIILLAFVGSSTTVTQNHSPQLKLSLDFYDKTIVYFSVDATLEKGIMEAFKKLVTEQGSQVQQVESVSDALINLGETHMDEYKEKAVVAMEFNRTSAGSMLINMMYSNPAYHGAPIILNLAMSAIARANGYAGILTSNVPLQTNTEVQMNEFLNEVELIFLWIILAPIALLFLVTSYIHFPLIERITNFKHLVYMAGVKPIAYWFKMFAYDFAVLYFTPALVMCIILVCNPLYSNAFGCMLAMFLCYGIMMIPFVFLFSYRKSLAAAIGSLSTVTIFTGMVFSFVVTIMRFSEDTFYENFGKVLHVIGHVSPQYWLTNNLITFSRKALWVYKWDNMGDDQKETSCRLNYQPCCAKRGIVDERACDQYRSYFVEGLAPLKLLLVTIGVFLLMMFLLCLLDSMRFKYLRTKLKNKLWGLIRRKYQVIDDMPDGLAEEGMASPVASGQGSDEVFKADSLKMIYNNKEVVKKVSFSVKSGQCYGLLGVNGAGKTTTFKMLTGFEVPTQGDAVVRSNRIAHNLNAHGDSYFKTIGYCPQFNAINEHLSVRLLLTIFARLRDVPECEVKTRVQQTIDNLALSEFADVPCGGLSGGNKRKLCLGISIIGKPPVNFLDEPTTGVDPVSRRKIWDVIRQIKRDNVSLVLTSHSMDECEILCDELAIMSKGIVHVNGSINQLKLEFGNGLTVKIKLKERNAFTDEVDSSSAGTTDDIAQYVEKYFPADLQLKDKHEGLLHFFIPKRDCGTKDLLDFFEKMETLKANYDNVVDYTINTSTLEDIFLAIANESEHA